MGSLSLTSHSQMVLRLLALLGHPAPEARRVPSWLAAMADTHWSCFTSYDFLWVEMSSTTTTFSTE